MGRGCRHGLVTRSYPGGLGQGNSFLESDDKGDDYNIINVSSGDGAGVSSSEAELPKCPSDDSDSYGAFPMLEDIQRAVSIASTSREHQGGIDGRHPSE